MSALDASYEALSVAAGGPDRLAVLIDDDPRTVDGVRPAVVARPRDAESVAACLRVAGEHGLASVPTGLGTKLTWGAPPRRCDVLLDLSGLDRIVEHSPGEFVVVAEAGVRLSALQARLAETGQQLALDPTRDGTLGGIVATADHGPARLAYGAPRDLVIGAHLARADGVLAKSGGKVVKNVAGYDLGKLLAGSFGTLAVLTRLAFRLHPLPAARRWVTVSEADPQRLHAATQALIHSTIVPAAIEVTRRGSGARAEGALSVLVQGVEAGAQGCAQGAVELLGRGAGAELTDAPPPWWVAVPEPPGALLVKLTFEISRVAEAVAAVDVAAQQSGLTVALRASTGIGVARLSALDESPDPQAQARFVTVLRDCAASYGGAAVLLDGHAATKAAIDPWGPVRGLPLMRAVKDSFDPAGSIAPGRFVGGI